MTANAQKFKDDLVGAGYVIDPEGVHHKFAGGMHGRKIDFDTIPTESALFEEGMDAMAEYIRFLYGPIYAGKLALVGVANGANRFVEPIAQILGKGTAALQTKKESPQSVSLTESAKDVLESGEFQTAVIVEDVGTTGLVASTAVLAVRPTAIEFVDTVFGWQRRQSLERMRAVQADHYSLIYDHWTYPTYTPEECRAIGHCAAGWELIEHQK